MWIKMPKWTVFLISSEVFVLITEVFWRIFWHDNWRSIIFALENFRYLVLLLSIFAVCIFYIQYFFAMLNVQFSFSQLSKKALLSTYFTSLALCKLCKIIWILHFSQGQKISALLLLLALLIRYVFDSTFMDQTILFNCSLPPERKIYLYIVFSNKTLISDLNPYLQTSAF